MAWFSNSETATLPAPSPVVDRCEEAQARVREVKAELDSLNSDMLAFKNKHSLTTDRFGRILGMVCPLLERPTIEAAWRALLHRRDKLMDAWPVALTQLADARRK